MSSAPYDVLIVGAGIAGCSLAHALSTLPRAQPLRIALLERSLAEPDRIVGELLQPGGISALRSLGMEACLEGIDAIPTYGYCVIENGQSVHIPYPDGHEGRGFHHGKFIMKLREAAQRAQGVDVIEATVTDLLEEESSQRVIGVRATRKDGVEKEAFRAGLVIVADGCFSNFRTAVMGDRGCKPVVKSHFVGLILEDAVLPIPRHGTVALTKGYGPALMYQIGEHDTRLLVDVKAPLPSDLKAHISSNIVPQLPPALHLSIQDALKNDRLRRMPNSFLPAIVQGSESESSLSHKQGVFLLGDAWNMRHPLTGGGMTVAFHDVVLLRGLFSAIDDLSQWSDVARALKKWHWARKPLTSTINILSVALYDLFGADDEILAILRTGCFKYFERGGACVTDPVSLLSGIVASPMLLMYHFFSVAFYSIWAMFTHPQTVHLPDQKPRQVVPRLDQYPFLFLKALRVIWRACVVFGPLLWSEIRWWSPDDQKASRKATLVGVGMSLPVVVLLAVVAANLV